MGNFFLLAFCEAPFHILTPLSSAVASALASLALVKVMCCVGSVQFGVSMGI